MRQGMIFLSGAFILLMGLCLDSQAIGKKTNVVKHGHEEIGGGGREINSSTSCAPAKWGGDLKNSCSCCVVKHMTKAGMHQKFDEKKIQVPCAKYCSSETLTALQQKIGLAAHASPKTIYTAINNNFGGLQFIKLSPQGTDKLGNLNEEGVVELLGKVKKSKKTPAKMKAMLKSPTYAAKKLSGGGAQTLQLFLVGTNPPSQESYILKGLKKATVEIANIQTIRRNPLGKKYEYHRGDAPVLGKPVLALDIHNFKYRDSKNKDHEVALITTAPGEDFGDYIKRWSTHSSDKPLDSGKLSRALYRMGSNLALIHGDFNKEGRPMGKTYVHGDLHPHNVFYDEKNDRMVFIDTESFAISIKQPRDPSVDIMKFWGRLVATANNPNHNYQQKIPDQQFQKVVIEPFIEGYVRGYAGSDPRKQRMVFDRLRQIMTTQGALQTFVQNNKTVLNAQQLAQKQKTIGIPGFEAVGRKLFGTSGKAMVKGKR